MAAAPPVVLRIKVRYEQAEAFVERFAPYVARAGLFLRSKAPKPVGTEVRFELRLADDKPVLVGMGVVRWAREVDPEKPYQPPGMAIEFTRVTKESREIILRMLELRRKLQLVDGPRGLPNPPDDDVAVTAASTASATATAVREEPSAPVSTWRRPATTALEPMAARPRRAAPSELVASVISSASVAPLSDAFGEIEVEEANLPGVLARARALAGNDVDRELAALLEEQAVPVEHDIEEVSARLASLLGTAPVSRRNRKNDSVPTESRPSFVPPPKVAMQISADLVPAPAPAPQLDVTKVVSLEAFAQLTEGATKVVNLEALAATTAPDAEDRTNVLDLRKPAGDDERTQVISARDVERASARLEDSADDTLDFDRPAPTIHEQVPRDFLHEEAERDQSTNVRARPPRRTSAPPPPKRPTPSPFNAVPEDDEAPTTAEPVEPDTGIMDFSRRPGTDSGSIDLTDLVSEADLDVAPPVPLGQHLDGEARDAADLIADVSDFDRRRVPAPEGPYPDLASFADPPSSFPRAARPESLDAALAALDSDADDSDGTPGDDLRTSYERPPSGGRVPSGGSSPVAVPIDDDDDLDIEIEFDDE
jgi:uncharacterized protein (TIGR02266 family)